MAELPKLVQGPDTRGCSLHWRNLRGMRWRHQPHLGQWHPCCPPLACILSVFACKHAAAQLPCTSCKLLAGILVLVCRFQIS